MTTWPSISARSAAGGSNRAVAILYSADDPIIAADLTPLEDGSTGFASA